MIDREKMAAIRSIPERFRQDYENARRCGCTEGLAWGLASDHLGKEAVEAVELLLAEIDRREDDLK